MADVVREISNERGTVGGGSVSKTLEISVVKVGVSGDVARTMIIDFGQLQAQPTWGSIQGKPTFADVAFSGSYDDLTDKPVGNVKSIPFDTTDFDGLNIGDSVYTEGDHWLATVQDKHDNYLHLQFVDHYHIVDYIYEKENGAWEEIDEYETDLSLIDHMAQRPSEFTEGNIGVFGDDGNVVDSGLGPDALLEDVRYDTNVGVFQKKSVDSDTYVDIIKTSTLKAYMGLDYVTNDAQVKRSEMGAPLGVATLNAQGKVRVEQMPQMIIVDRELSSTSENPVQNKVVKAAVDSKQDTLQSGVNIKTVNNESLLGSGNINIQGGGSADAVLYTEQSLTGEQQAQARANIGAGTYSKPSGGIPSSDIASGVIPDVSGFITKSVNDLTNYYLKSETYTKAEVAALIGAIQQFHYEIYATLPASGESNVLYLIGPTGTGTDKYEEYVYANNDFTKIGDTSIDLSGYVTTSALNTALADYTTTANLTTLLAGKQDTISDLATIRSGAALGATAYQKPSTGIPATDLASGVIPQPEVFVATYGTTTYQQIVDANTVGKVVYVKKADENLTLPLIKIDANCALFGGEAYGYQLYFAKCLNSNDWSKNMYSAEILNNRVTSWQATPSNNKYPSEKLVKDSIDAVDKVFWATYGTTTAAEIDAAVAAGKLIVVKVAYNASTENILYYTNFNNSANPYFSCVSDNCVYCAICNRTSGTWSNTRIFLQAQYDKVSTIAGNETKTTKYPNTKAVADALGKWGVVSQTQTWTQASDLGHDYTMSDLVYGTIPQANIDLFESAGATFNATTGYFELNGLTDISYEEMCAIYVQNIPNPWTAQQGMLVYPGIRTNIPPTNNIIVHTSFPAIRLAYAYNNKIEKIYIVKPSTKAQISNLQLGFFRQLYLREIIGLIDVTSSTNFTQAFERCYSLEDIKLFGVKANLSFSDSSRLSKDSLLYLINNASTTNFTVTLHPDVYAKTQSGGAWYSDVSTALSSHTNVTLASA